IKFKTEYNYERDQQRLLRLFEEVQTDEEFDDEVETTENDVVEERSEDSDTEEEIKKENESEQTVNTIGPHFNVRTRIEYILGNAATRSRS
ncbi:hypothetical protein JTB14_024567, partial [Gonioctena quinquepunctata]